MKKKKTPFFLHNLSGCIDEYYISNFKFTLEGEDKEYILGREGSLSFPESSISRKHLKISIKNGKVRILDLDSTNGTIVNNRKLTPNRNRILKEGDVIKLGEVEWKFTQQEKFNTKWLKRPYILCYQYTENKKPKYCKFVNIEAALKYYKGYFKQAPPLNYLVSFLDMRHSYSVFKLVKGK